MRWESKVANQMLFGLCLFKNITPSWMAPLAALLLFSSYQLVGFRLFSALFTSLAVLICSVLYIWKHKPVSADKSVEEAVLSSEEENSNETENTVPTPMRMNETATEAKETQEEQDSDGTASTYSATSPDKLLEIECNDQLSTSENTDVDHNPECPDGSISDEKSLIEIAIPSGHFVGQHKEELKYNCSLQQNNWELPAESLFSKQSLMEFLVEFNEMNEEENLIEIDISMGVIKYSSLK